MTKISYIFILIFGIVHSQNSNRMEVILSDVKSIEELKIVIPYVENFNGIPSVFPLKNATEFKITSIFGSRFHPIEKHNKFHNGIDIAAEIGTLVVATADGRIKNVKFSNFGHGRTVVIKHKYGFSTRYSHLAVIFPDINTSIKKGEVIGMVGSTGKSTGNHIHYEVTKNRMHLNPDFFFFIDQENSATLRMQPH